MQEIIGAIRFYPADGGWVVTNRQFSPNARRLAEANAGDRKRLLAFLADLAQKSGLGERKHSEKSAPTWL